MLYEGKEKQACLQEDTEMKKPHQGLLAMEALERMVLEVENVEMEKQHVEMEKKDVEMENQMGMEEWEG